MLKRTATNFRLATLALMRTHLLLAAILVPTLARAQDVHVRVSPDVKTGIESTTEYPTIQMAMDHHPLAGPAPGKDGRPARVYIEIAPGTIFPNSFSLHRMEYGLP